MTTRASSGSNNVRLSLISKLTLTTGLILIITMTLFAYINVAQLEKLLLEEAVSDADKLSETIIRTTHYQMLENDRERVYQMMKEAGSQQGLIERIRMINKDGSIIYSTDEKEIGTYLDKKAEACNMCHAGETPLVHASTMNRSRFFQTRDGRQVLGLAKAIYNQESCATAACHFHPAKAKVLGVLDVIVSLDPMLLRVKTYRTEIIVLTLLQLALLSICLIILTQKLINKPVRQLVQHTRRIGQGQLDSVVEIDSHDELGILADSFNHMTTRLKTARDELEDWGRNLETIVEERTREIKQIQAQLVRSEKLAALGELVAGIAHEINNPLTGILVFASLLENDSRLDPALKEDLALINRETQRCATIVKGLLDFSRESVPHKKPVSLNKIMDETIALVEHQSSFHDITVIREYDPGLPPTLVDPNQIEQVFVNIILNASHAMPNGGELRIVSGIDANDSFVFLGITDNGCGIQEENLKKIFDPFFTTKQNKGTGLGLSVSYGIISSHGGTIEVKSTVGVGTTFTIKLPREPNPGAAKQSGLEAFQTQPGALS